MLNRMLQSAGIDVQALHTQAETLANAAVHIAEVQNRILENQEAHSAALRNIMNRLDAMEQLGNRLLVEPGAKEVAYENAQELAKMDESAAVKTEASPVDSDASAN